MFEMGKKVLAIIIITIGIIMPQEKNNETICEVGRVA